MQGSATRNWIGPLALMGAAVIWGLSPVASRYAQRTLTPGQVVLAQSLFASIALIPYLAIVRTPMPPRRHVWRAVALGLLATIGYGLPVTYGVQHIEAGTAALLSGTSPIFIAAFSVMFLREQVGIRLVVGLVLALTGSIVVAAVGDAGFGVAQAELLGSALVLLAALLWGVYSVAAKPWLGRIPATSLPIIGRFASVPVAIPFGAAGFGAALGDLDWKGWLAVVAYAIGAGVVAQVLFAIGLQRGAASRAGMYLYLTPLFGVVGGILLLGESIYPEQAIGGIMILAGVAIATLFPARRSLVPSSAEQVAD